MKSTLKPISEWKPKVKTCNGAHCQLVIIVDVRKTTLFDETYEVKKVTTVEEIHDVKKSRKN